MSTKKTTKAETIPDNCDFAPPVTFMLVLDILPAVGKHPKKLPNRLQVPSAMSS